MERIRSRIGAGKGKGENKENDKGEYGGMRGEERMEGGRFGFGFKFVFVVERFDFIFHRLCSVVIIVSFGLILRVVSNVCGGWTRDRERQCSRKNNTDLWAMREGRVFQCGPPHPPRQLQHEDSDRQMRGRQVA